ncbi:MAG TPA: sialidase family protein [Gaiellaceae bacterium]|nr:sialidase family protein [Gaiellaceae bacterium]
MAAGVLASAMIVGFSALVLDGASPGEPEVEAEMPNALAAHLADLKEAVPGNEGMSPEGPGGAAAAAFDQRAYPDTTISLGEMERARDAFAAVRSRQSSAGVTATGNWVLVGPSRALYPSSSFLNSLGYVPNEYIAGGRTTSIAVSDTCNASACRLYITPAGGGIWTTQNGLAPTPQWEYLGGPLGINSAGAVTIDQNDPSGNTVYVGTGEANICGSGCVAGVGIYKSIDGGQTWTGPLGGGPTDTGNPLAGKGVGEILIKPGSPNTIYAATTTALRGMSESCCVGVTRPVPGAAKWGLYKSTNGGATWNFIHNGSANASDCKGSLAEFANTATCSPRGVRSVALDPTDSEIVYAGSYARGIWRSPDGGTTWTQIKPSLNQAVFQTRVNLAVTTLPNGNTRMYVLEGNNGTNTSRLFRSDSVRTGTPVFTNMTSNHVKDPGFAWHAICDPQCWYDSFVYTPKGHPDIVYAGGDYAYGETIANKRGVVLSTDAGVTGTDMTFDGTDPLHPNGLHPDQHDIVTNPNNPLQFFETSDGGVMRSSGELVDRSSWCTSPPNRGLNPVETARCRQMLSAIPTKLDGINDGVSTLQWIKVKASPHNPELLQGGTQDNGTWETPGDPVTWENTMIGDGGWNGFDVGLPNFRFHSFYDVSPEVNFEGGSIATWIWVADPLFGHAGSNFYSPIINDPVISGTMFAGTGRTAYRTKTHGLGSMTMTEAQQHCNSWTGDFAPQLTCGDWAELGPVRLTASDWGDRAGGNVAAVERTTANTSTAWAATSTGRLFITKNVNAEPTVERRPRIPADDPYTQRVAPNVSWTRLDDDATIDPNRFVSSIYVDPANGNHAWISYSGYGANTPGASAHVVEVTYNQATGTSTWVDLSHNFGDLPVNDLVRDDVTGDLYAGTDFGALRLAAGTSTWTNSAPGLPNVEVTSLEIVPSERILYAATHGRSTWRLDLG